MLQNPARSHGRVLFSSTRPSARLSADQFTSPNSTSTLHQTVVASTTSSSVKLRLVNRQQCLPYRTKASGPAANAPAKLGRHLTMDLLQAPNPLSQALQDTGLWHARGLNKATEAGKKGIKKLGRPKKNAVQYNEQDDTNTKDTPVRKRATKGDKSRVQITNEVLVKDMIGYIKPTLERHRGCDLISVYPGAGAWAKALHEAVQPRSHLLLEPDEMTYRPFLQPLLDQENVRLIPRSGIVWEDLDAVLTPEYLPNQVAIDKRALPDGPPNNDTLLVSMNLAMFPKKKFGTFQSVSRMVLFQLLQTIRTSTLYQKYGRVRMFIWIPDDEKHGVLPRVLNGRRRSAIEGELTTEYITEVCGRDVAAEYDHSTFKKGSVTDVHNQDRWPQMELESARLCKIRMQQRGLVTPPGRSTSVMKSLDALIADNPSLMNGIPMCEMRQAVGGKGVATESEYKALLQLHKKKNLLAEDPNFIRLKALEQYYINVDSAFKHAVKFIKETDAVVDAYKAAAQAQAQDPSSGNTAKLLTHAQKLEAKFNASAPLSPKYRREYNFMARDAVHILKNQPPHLGPVMSWDRRPYEPLPAMANDFFPNVPCALLDIQPRAVHPLLRSMGPGTDNAGDIFDMILGVLTDLLSSSVEKQFSAIWPDPARGGIPMTGAGAITNRCLNSEQLTEILEEFMKWPFRPSHADLVGRLTNDDASDDDADMYVKGNAAWQAP
ncbi:hypothetical protein N0V93_007943 [Gnomoniopsis smithogilvyi]|uniref:rRNA adenine N(6)-methyltransferase n=1 Tax=Gnomoniopsis smithogilvyi TaxID=1191159 RepID=A0A9W8YL30_9PEZI|nr:hypothetical protein N0V93_007943 [Gnomoniopsis smithogilvyi]